MLDRGPLFPFQGCCRGDVAFLAFVFCVSLRKVSNGKGGREKGRKKEDKGEPGKEGKGEEGKEKERKKGEERERMKEGERRKR